MPLQIEDYDSLVDDSPEPLQAWADAKDGLLLAADAVYRQRDEQYGESYTHHSQTAALWSILLGHHVEPAQVSIMFILDKIVRSKTEDKPDHWVDVCGYAQVHAAVQAATEAQLDNLNKLRRCVVQDAN